MTEKIEELEKALADQVIPSADEVAAGIDLAALAKSAAELVPPPKDADMGALNGHSNARALARTLSVISHDPEPRRSSFDT